jgi:peptidoglycan/LPS O-acetylase OafA/YrhL
VHYESQAWSNSKTFFASANKRVYKQVYHIFTSTSKYMIKGKTYFKNLDALRFIAAAMVLLQHLFSPSYKYLPIKNTIWEKMLNLVSTGGTGVSIFFVLSGFLITYLLITEYELNKKISIRDFYLRRVLRIWPLYYLIIAFSFVAYPFLKSVAGMYNPLESKFLYHISFLTNFDVINIQKNHTGLGAMSQNITWSVSIEEQFYLFWPLIFGFLPKKTWPYSIVFVIALSLFFRILNNNDLIVLYFHTLSVLLDLGIGGLVAYFIKENNKVKAFFEKSNTVVHLTLFITSFCLLYWADSIFAFPYGNALGRIFISASFALIIAAQAITKQESILNLKNLSFASRWGKYTYGIYLIHPVAITLIDVALRLLHVTRNNFLSVFATAVAGFIFTLVLSKISYKYFESRFLKLKDKFSTVKSHE